jgi:hypothetical protein
MSYATDLLAGKLPALIERYMGRIPTTAPTEQRLDAIIKGQQQIVAALEAVRLAIVSKGK